MAMRHMAPFQEAARVLEGLRGRSLIRAANLTSAEVHATFSVARALREGQLRMIRPLADRIVCTAFFEPSTRTRLSFESAALRLGASTLSIPDGRVTGAAKGESLADIGRMLQTYADLVVLRHPDPECLREIRRCGMTLPLINGGNGQQEHPTQALSDWFTLTEAFPDEEPLHLGVVGVPSSMRTLRSFLLLGLAVFPHLIGRLTVVCERRDNCLDAELVGAARAAGVAIHVREDLTRLAPDLDVIYVNALTNINGRYELKFHPGTGHRGFMPRGRGLDGSRHAFRGACGG
ncbi:hypothetical protein F8271_31330 [Micromonospora sp. ALFpr18c]|uniref:hypothetical protein n=1 Tax=Micromonospora sp. ALFpr18c TaxID=1458665 RepID=UPI00124AEDD9|nr:hypothetical protein [Micromonospora sp. ALFpr18c]KAB1922111.1 hypothetical protein F8271_31330 [Micromonospora sp. ALFpr18c]